jgi:DNA polymerase III, alpha subunit
VDQACRRRRHHAVRLPTCEGLGLLKMDFLGLRNLTIMADAVA